MNFNEEGGVLGEQGAGQVCSAVFTPSGSTAASRRRAKSNSHRALTWQRLRAPCCRGMRGRRIWQDRCSAKPLSGGPRALSRQFWSQGLLGQAQARAQRASAGAAPRAPVRLASSRRAGSSRQLTGITSALLKSHAVGGDRTPRLIARRPTRSAGSPWMGPFELDDHAGDDSRL